MPGKLCVSIEIMPIHQNKCVTTIVRITDPQQAWTKAYPSLTLAYREAEKLDLTTMGLSHGSDTAGVPPGGGQMVRSLRRPAEITPASLLSRGFESIDGTISPASEF